MTDQTARLDTGSTPRRSVLKGAVVAGAALPFLAACGGGSDTSGSGGSPGSDPTSGGGSSAGGSGGSGGAGGSGGGSGGGADVLTTTSQVPNGGGVILDDAGYVVTQPDAGEFKGFTNICTHMGCPVSDVSNGTINCFCHGSQYSITDGSVVAGPAPRPLPEKPITVKGKQILSG